MIDFLRYLSGHVLVTCGTCQWSSTYPSLSSAQKAAVAHKGECP